MEDNLNQISELRRRIVLAAFKAREGHVPSALSILDILWVLYNDVLHVNPSNPNDESRDRFILSKGHGSLGLYVVLSEFGFFPLEELESYCSSDSILGGHPHMCKVPGVELSTGSLGHGFPMSIGIALALKIRKSPARVYVLVGDGECNEGPVWESFLLGAHHCLNNLTCVIDYNHSGDRALGLGDLHKKISSFGWNCLTIDGHDAIQLKDAFREAASSPVPFCIVANTIKGKGIPTMENNPAWHHKAPSAEEVKTIIQQLDKTTK